MAKRIDEICARPDWLTSAATQPLAAPIFPATVYRCATPEQANGLLAGEIEGFVYSRDGHPNGEALAERCAELHGAADALVTGSGMSALALAMVGLLQHGDHVVVSDQLYGKSFNLFTAEAARLGIVATPVDMCDVEQVATAMGDQTRLLVVETIANPMLRVADLAALAETAHRGGARLLVDNTFASPAICRPLQLGADYVMESITKIMNGHSDVMLGLLAGVESDDWQRLFAVHSTWGFFASPMDCWLATRGLGTLALRVERAAAGAAATAETLLGRAEVPNVYYPGLREHPDHEVAAAQFGERFGNIVTFTLAGGRAAAERFIAAAADSIPFCPSLGELSTTLSHPESTSHRLMSAEQRQRLGIEGGTIRLSVGIESPEHVVDALQTALQAAASSPP